MGDMADMHVEDERAEELDSIESIFPELVRNGNKPYTATLELRVAPLRPLTVTFDPDQHVERLAHLPPLRLDIDLPVNYPAEIPPIVTLSTSPSWLPKDTQAALTADAKLQWDDCGGMVMLYSYIVHIQDLSETAFGLDELQLPSTMRRELVNFNRQMKKELFEQETFDCEVCLEPKKGSACYRMTRCSHVFCVTCLQDYYNSCITEGNIHSVKCMSTECSVSSRKGKKKERMLSPKELLQIPIPREQVDRYAKMKRKKKMESDPSIVFCPRTWCQGAMRTEKYPMITDISQMDDSASEAEDDEDEESPPDNTRNRIDLRGMDRVQVCEDCNFAFCGVCLASWHGLFAPCVPRNATHLTEEDQASIDFITKNTSACPYCSAPCQKSHGCNHMICAQCKTHFCYICAAWLNPKHPYEHFNNRWERCFYRLMDGAEGDVGNVDPQFGGRRGAEQLADYGEQEALRMQMLEFDDDTR